MLGISSSEVQKEDRNPEPPSKRARFTGSSDKTIIAANEMDEELMSPQSPTSTSAELEKSKKYDRQLRLWGETGQQHIEQARVCLVNANAMGTEILKSLVLPGVGSFTIVDNKKVTDQDSNNFFVTSSSLGCSRAQVTTQLLTEMNPLVQGDYVEQSLDVVLKSNEHFWKQFTVVIASNVWNENYLTKLSRITWHLNIPLITCFSIGFVGSIQVQVAEHPVIESHPDYVLEDLRLDKPFNELQEFLNENLDIEHMSIEKLAHTPYIVIIYKYLKQWQVANGKQENELPANLKEKDQLKKVISTAMNELRHAKMKGEEDHDVTLENFEEAIKALNQVLTKSESIPSEVQKILQDSSVDLVLNSSTEKISNCDFWLMIAALKQFIQKTNSLPVRGRIPDMLSDSARYIQLQIAYMQKSKEDREMLFNIIKEICLKTGRSFANITDQVLKTFTCNCHCLRLIRTSAVFQELELANYSDQSKRLSELIANYCFDPENKTHDFWFYLMIRSVSKFYTEFGYFPGNENAEKDIVPLQTHFKLLLSDLGIEHISNDDFIKEMCFYGGSELHSVSSFLAGAVAQETIKLITHQYTPLNNLMVYNANTSVTTTFLL